MRGWILVASNAPPTHTMTARASNHQRRRSTCRYLGSSTSFPSVEGTCLSRTSTRSSTPRAHAQRRSSQSLTGSLTRLCSPGGPAPPTLARPFLPSRGTALAGLVQDSRLTREDAHVGKHSGQPRGVDHNGQACVTACSHSHTLRDVGTF